MYAVGKNSRRGVDRSAEAFTLQDPTPTKIYIFLMGAGATDLFTSNLSRAEYIDKICSQCSG
jgi:hypothetical protein